MWALPAAADDLGEFQQARNAYQTGEWALAAERFEALLEREPPASRAIREESLQYLGATRLFLGLREEADAAFERLLILDPDWELDAAVFPTPVLDEFSRIKMLMRERLASLRQAEAAAAEADRQRRIEQYGRDREALSEALAPQYLARLDTPRSLYLAFVPFGVGQFQNGEDTKGWVFFGLEAALLAGNIWTFLSWDWYTRERAEAQAGDYDRRAEEAAAFADGYRIASWTLLGAFVAIAVAGIIDAIVMFDDPGIQWRRIGTDEVPEEYRLPSRDPDDYLRPPPELAPQEATGFNLHYTIRF